MYKEIAANRRRTVVMLLLFVLLVAGLGWLIGEYLGSPAITPYVLVGAGIYVLFSYWSGSKMALALNGAKEIKKSDNPRLWRTVENLAITNGQPMPKVYIIDDTAPNAFATGRDPKHAVVGVTSGLLDIMEDGELEGVIAHELGHIKNYDIRVSLIAFALVAVVSILADIMLRIAWYNDDRDTARLTLVLGIAGAILAPLAAICIQLAIARKREYLADATGVLTTRYPEGLAKALAKIGKHARPLKKQNPSTAHLFLVNPLKKGFIASLFSTHPPIEDRIKKLNEMGRSA